MKEKCLGIEERDSKYLDMIKKIKKVTGVDKKSNSDIIKDKDGNHILVVYDIMT